MDDSIETNIARRNVLKTGALAATASAVPLGAIAQTPHAGGAGTPAAPAGAPVTSKVSLRVNGKQHELTVDTRTSLLDVLRENLHLTGTKKGCDQGQCGACTIIVDGRRINSCLSLAIMHDG
ncbi:2Fe-2S iron-sulfur cluster-binding protein, partial [Massilia sp.]|uniref:2Fe-2S iron-sulfur cluster-binding protein n=1 Tax=Massilia sp. TaxID=1882437 RepID=UPI0028A60CE7